MKYVREVKITPVLNGWIVKIGCQSVVFNDLKYMLGELQAYFENPDKTEERYQETAVNAKHIRGLTDDEEARMPDYGLPTVAED